MDLSKMINGIVAGFVAVVVALIILPIALDQANVVAVQYSAETWAPLLSQVVPIMLVIAVVGIGLALYNNLSKA